MSDRLRRDVVGRSAASLAVMTVGYYIRSGFRDAPVRTRLPRNVIRRSSLRRVAAPAFSQEERMNRGLRPFGALVAVASVAALAGPASAATPTDTTALQSAVKVGNDKSGIRQPPQAAAADRRPARQQRHPLDGDAGPRGLGRLREEAAGHGRRPTGRVTEQPFSTAVFEELAPPTLTLDARGLAGVGCRTPTTRRWTPRAAVWSPSAPLGVDRLRRAHHHGEHLDRRLRGRRLPGQPGRQGRADPARYLRLRAEGQERAGPRSASA